MAFDKNYKNFTAADIEKYHKGLLSAKERHDLEKAALDDPFLADALEGYASAGTNLDADLADLQNRLREKSQTARVIPLKPAGSRKIPWLRVAALIILIIGAAVLTYQFGFNNNRSDSPIAIAPQEKKESNVADSSVPPQLDAKANNTTTAADSPVLQNGSVSGTLALEPVTRSSRDKLVEKDAATTYYEAKPNQEVVTAPAAGATNIWKDTAATIPAGKPELAAESGYKKLSEPNKNQDYTLREEVSSKTEQAKRKMAAAKERQMSDDRYIANIFRGRVTDGNNNPVPFANVTNTEDNVGTYADARGYFNLTSPDSTLNVQVRSLGFNNNVVQLKTNVYNNAVVMQEDRSISPVVVSNKKPNSTYRASAANMKLEGEPEPEDGWDNYDSYLANNLNVPEDFKIRQSGTGEVKVSFEVNKYGEPVNFKIEKSLCNQCDQEAIRLIKAGPKWKRHAKKGRTTVTISF